MQDLIDTVPSWLPIAVALSIVAMLLVLLLFMRRQSGSGPRVVKALERISYDRFSNIVIPNGDDGEIHVDLVLLTGHGILVVDLKDVSGVVFGSDRMQDWRVIDDDRRYTFANPQPALYDRIAAVRHIVGTTPVDGALLFADTARFTKGVPAKVFTLRELLAEYPKADRRRPEPELADYRSGWDQLRDAAVGARVGSLVASG